MHFRAAVSAAAIRSAATSRGHRRLLVAALVDLRRLLAASRQLQPDTHSPLHPLGPRPLLRAPRSPRRRRPPLPRATAAPPGPCTCLALPCAVGLPVPSHWARGSGLSREDRLAWEPPPGLARAPLRTLAQAPARRALEGSPAPTPLPAAAGAGPAPDSPQPSHRDSCPPHPHPATHRSPSPNPVICSATPAPHSGENSVASTRPPPAHPAICPTPLGSPTNDLFPSRASPALAAPLLHNSATYCRFPPTEIAAETPPLPCAPPNTNAFSAFGPNGYPQTILPLFPVSVA